MPLKGRRGHSRLVFCCLQALDELQADIRRCLNRFHDWVGVALQSRNASRQSYPKRVRQCSRALDVRKAVGGVFEVVQRWLRGVAEVKMLPVRRT